MNDRLTSPETSPRRAFLFPGQGSQTVGMGSALADRYRVAREVFDEVDEALGQALSRLMVDGPAQDLTLTANAQPALMAVSLAAIRVLEAEAGLDLRRDASFVAGHSLGEYSALAATGALSLADAARLLRLRGQAMQDAVPAGQGAMAALIGAEPEVASAIAAEASTASEVCALANDNGGGQSVLSGHATAVERAVAIAKSRGVKRAVMLSVSAPFHCMLMQPAAERMAAALATAHLTAPVIPLISNRDAAPLSDPAALKAALVAQITGTVRWRECVLRLQAARVEATVEVGTGAVLSGLVRRIAPSLAVLAVGTPEGVDAYRASVAEQAHV